MGLKRLKIIGGKLGRRSHQYTIKTLTFLRSVDYVRLLRTWLLDLFFPIRCVSCGKYRVGYLCARCSRTIPLKGGSECIGCKRTSPDGATCTSCADTFAVDRLLIAADYGNPLLRRALKLFKYQFVPDVAPDLYFVVHRYLRELRNRKGDSIVGDNPLVVPVPLHRRRLNWRGFNQSELLARLLADQFLLEMRDNVLVRTRQTRPQADIQEREQRLENVSGVINCTDPDGVRGRTILLVDDVCTSGATLDECAKVLKQNGARKVIALVVARG